MPATAYGISQYGQGDYRQTRQLDSSISVIFLFSNPFSMYLYRCVLPFVNTYLDIKYCLN